LIVAAHGVVMSKHLVSQGTAWVGE
jgi:hypothetical protein